MRAPVFICALSALLLLEAAAGSAKSRRPIRKIDYQRIVGRPVLHQGTPKEGVHVWLHQGYVNFGAVARASDLKKNKKTVYTFRVSHDKPVRAAELGDFRRTSKKKSSFFVRVYVGKRPATGRFKTEGDVTLSEAKVGTERSRAQIYVGPTQIAAAASVQIGRF